MAYQVCRLCLAKGINLTALSIGEESMGERLSACVPEINICIINDPLICANCIYMLDVSYKFRNICLQTEWQINKSLKNLYLKSIGCGRRETQSPAFQLDETHTSFNTFNTYLNTSILQSLAETLNKTEECGVARKRKKNSKLEQVQPCHVVLNKYSPNYRVTTTDEEAISTCTEKKSIGRSYKLDEMNSKEIQSSAKSLNKALSRQNELNEMNSKEILSSGKSSNNALRRQNISKNNKLNYKNSKRIQQKHEKRIKEVQSLKSHIFLQKNKMNPNNKQQIYFNKMKTKEHELKAKQMKLCVKESPEYKLRRKDDYSEIDTENVCKSVTRSALIIAHKTDPNIRSEKQFQNRRSIRNLTKNTFGKNAFTKNLVSEERAFYKRGRPKKIDTETGETSKSAKAHKVSDNAYAKVYRTIKRKVPESILTYETKVNISNKDSVDGKRVLRNSSSENKVHKNSKLQENEDLSSKTGFCEMCNIVFNNFEVWKKHIKDHIFAY